MSKPILLHKDEHQIKNEIHQIREVASTVDKLYQHFKSLNLFKLKSEDLTSLILLKEEFIKDRLAELMEEPPKIFGFSVNRKNVVNLLELPDFTTISELCENCKPYLGFTSFLTIQNERVMPSPDYVDKITADNSIVAKTEKQIKMANAHLKAYEALCELQECQKEIFGHTLFRSEMPLKKLFRFDENNNLLDINRYLYVEHRSGLTRDEGK